MSMPPGNEFANRVARARSLMAERDLDGLVVTDAEFYSYFSGHKVPAWMKSRPSIFILPLEGAPAIIHWSGPEMFARLYGRAMPSWVEDRRIYPEVPLGFDPRTDWGVAEVLRERGLDKSRLGIELGRETWLGIPLTDFDLLREQLPTVTWADSGSVLWGCRMIKSEWEIDCMRRACEIGARAWGRCFDKLYHGISIAEVQQRVVAYYHEEGADLGAGPPMVMGATGPGDTFVKGDVLYIDGGCTYSGYAMDFARRAVFGEPSERQKDEHYGMWDVLRKVIDFMAPGVSLKDVFAYSQALLAEHPNWKNYSDHPAKRIGHGQGTGNEPPSISGTDDTVLQECMVLTPEPKIESVDGLVNPEEHVVIRSRGNEILSKSSNWELYIVN